MAFDPDFAGDTHSASSERRERRRQEDKKRMAYRRAIEDYRESQALQASFRKPGFLTAAVPMIT